MSVRRTVPWALWLIFLLSLPAVTPRIYASDEVQYFSYLRSLWFDHDVSFENEYRTFYDRGVARSEGFHETFLERTTETGRRINFATIGSALLWSPFYAVADLLARTTGRWPADGYSQPYLAAVAYGSACYGFLALLLSLRVADRWFGEGRRAALATWIGTPLLFYMYVAPPMSHACSAFAVAAFVAAWVRVRERWSAPGLALLGGLAALMAMVREQDLFIAIGPALDFGRAWWRADRDQRRTLALNATVGAVTAMLCYVPQALAYLHLNGYIGPSRLVARKMTWTAPHFLEVLFSPSHGFFVWTPMALFALVALLVFALRRDDTWPSGEARWVAACLIVTFLAQVYVAGSVESWTVAGAFGQRRFIAVSVILVFGLAALGHLVTRRRSRQVVGLAIVAATWWNLGLMAQFGAGLMDRQRLEPARNAYVTFVELPVRMPSLAWRYVFARESFYRPPR